MGSKDICRDTSVISVLTLKPAGSVIKIDLFKTLRFFLSSSSTSVNVLFTLSHYQLFTSHTLIITTIFVYISTIKPCTFTLENDEMESSKCHVTIL